MSEARPINPVVKQVLELGPPIAFFAIYMWLKDDTFTLGGTEYAGLVVATVIFVPILLVAMAILWALTGKLSRMQIFTAVMVIVFGGLTAWFNDERFIKIKTTIVYGLFAGLLGLGLLRGQSWLAYIMNEMVPMQQEGWMILTRNLCLCFAGLAIANEIVWRTMAEETWVTVETFGFPIVLVGFLMWQFMRLEPYLIDDKDDADQA